MQGMWRNCLKKRNRGEEKFEVSDSFLKNKALSYDKAFSAFDFSQLKIITSVTSKRISEDV